MGVLNIYDIMFAHDVPMFCYSDKKMTCAYSNSPGSNSGGGVCGQRLPCLSSSFIDIRFSNCRQNAVFVDHRHEAFVDTHLLPWPSLLFRFRCLIATFFMHFDV